MRIIGEEIDHDGTFEYDDADHVIMAHKHGKLSFHNAYKILTEKYNFIEDHALESLFDQQGTWDLKNGMLND